MTSDCLLKVNGSVVSYSEDVVLRKSTSSNGATSDLSVTLDNRFGVSKGIFSTGDSVDFWGGKAVFNDLISWWGFSIDGRDELEVNDATVNGPTLASGALGTGYLFSASGDNLSISSVSPKSLSFWFNPNVINSRTVFYDSVTGYFIGGDASGNLRVYDGSNNDGSTVLTTGGFNHYVLAYDGTGYNVFKNGLFSEKITCGQISIDMMGRDDANVFGGVLDEVGFYSSELNSEDANRLYNNGTPASVKKLFSGTCERIRFTSRGVRENIVVTCRDLGNLIQKRTVPPEVYTEQTINAIVVDLMSKYAPGIIDYSSIVVSSKVLTRWIIKHQFLWDALNDLAEQANFVVFVDEWKRLRFEPKSSVSSGVVFDSSNTFSSTFNFDIDQSVNSVWVYGGRQLVAAPTESLVFDGGSVVTLENQPNNTKVTVNGVDQVGEVFRQNTLPSSGTDYLVNFEDKQLVFVSGTTLGYSSIPASGDIGSVDYQVNRPIIKLSQDSGFISEDYQRDEVIVNEGITDPAMASDIARKTLANKKGDITDGRISVVDVFNLNPSETCICDFGNQNVNNEVLEVIECVYTFNRDTRESDLVLEVSVGERLDDFVDSLNQVNAAQKLLQASSIQTGDVITRFEIAAGSFGLGTNGWEVRTVAVNDSFVVGNPDLAIVGTSAVGDRRSAPVVVLSGGYI